jgi:DNA-binding MarR family transcriptional regulator
MSIKNHRKNLTIEDLFFLHLLENHNQSKYIATESITETGIQKKLNCDIGLISRIIKKNEEEGYIYRKVMKIKNKKRKQNAIFLSDEGMERAKDLQNNIGGRERKVR